MKCSTYRKITRSDTRVRSLGSKVLDVFPFVYHKSKLTDGGVVKSNYMKVESDHVLVTQIYCAREL
jgi:hypothetical protein